MQQYSQLLLPVLLYLWEMCRKVASVAHKIRPVTVFRLFFFAQRWFAACSAAGHHPDKSPNTHRRTNHHDIVYSSYIFYVSAAHLIFSSHVCRWSTAKTFGNILKLRAALSQMLPQPHSRRASPCPAQPQSVCVAVASLITGFAVCSYGRNPSGDDLWPRRFVCCSL